MKKRYFVFIFAVFCCISIFGDTDTQEEVDFLLFAPNSGNRFENEEKAFIQLNNLAQYLLGKNLVPGRIIVYGYAAYAPNEIKSVDLSKERALFVMDELQKRGVSKELFSDPVGHGAVYLWGNNENEDARKLNRRVRVLLDGEALMPVTQEIVSAETEASAKAEDIIPELVHNAPMEPEIAWYHTPKKESFKFPWWILPLLIFLGLCLLLIFLLGRRSRKTTTAAAANAKPQITETVIVPWSESAKAVTTYTVSLDEEIRVRAYELSQQRRIAGQCGGQDDYREQDWHNAVREISAWYIACGHSVFTDGGYWWASTTVDT
jgi:hypothetical protein